MTVTVDASARRRPGRVRALVAATALVGTSLVIGVTSPAARAADSSAALSLSGVTSQTYPTGGNTVWVQPGTSLTFTEAPISVGANKGLLGTVSSLLGGVVSALNPIVDLKATVDLSSVQRGTVNLGGGGGQASVATPALPKGVYPFAWSFTAITLLGNQVALNGNQLNPLGVKLNARNQYTGYIVSDTRSPCGGAQCLSLQTPTLSVAPSLPVVGQLPTITVPGTTVNIPVPAVPGVNAPIPGTTGTTAPPAGGAPAPGTPGTPGSTTSTTVTNPYGYTAPGCTGPCLVVPQGGGGGGSVGGAYDVTLGQVGANGSDSGTSAAAGSSDPASADGAVQLAAAAGQQNAGADRAFDQADRSGIGDAPLPRALTLLAIIALAGAIVLYARRRLTTR